MEIQEQADKNADKKYKSELKDTQSELDKAKKNLAAKDKESEINNKRLLKRLEQQERLIKEKEKYLQYVGKVSLCLFILVLMII